MNQLEVKNIYYSKNGKNILENISFQVSAGEILGILGPNGSGKSTLVKIISGEIFPDSGFIRINNKNIKQMKIPEQAEVRSILMQDTNFSLDFTSKEIVEIGRVIVSKNQSQKNEKEIINSSMELTDVLKFSERKVKSLSGGEKQRVDIARVIAQLSSENETKNRYLILDEPISNLDINFQLQILEICLKMAKLGYGIIIILHDLNIASSYCTNIVLLNNQKVFKFGPTKSILTDKNISEIYKTKLKTIKDSNTNKIYFIPINQSEEQKMRIEELKILWEKLKTENPKIRIRDAASKLKVSEMSLLQLDLGGTVKRINSNWSELFTEIDKLGKVMALTRNEACVHERKGIYKNFSYNAHSSLFVGDDIDLRIFFNNWKYSFSVKEGNKASFQFFDKNGIAVHKIHLLEESNFNEFEIITNQFLDKDQDYIETNIPEEITQEVFKPIDKDYSGFLNEWGNMQDTHDFFGLLKKHSIHRLISLEVAEGFFSKNVSNDSLFELFQKISHLQIPIMIFVGNNGIIQIHTGEVHKIVPMGEWVNIMDENFNLHLNKELIYKTYLVEKPTKDGIVTSIEAFDSKGELIIQIFGKRKPGLPERNDWRKILEETYGKIKNKQIEEYQNV